jgi:hypothetical protein
MNLRANGGCVCVCVCVCVSRAQSSPQQHQPPSNRFQGNRWERPEQFGKEKLTRAWAPYVLLRMRGNGDQHLRMNER